MSCILYLFRADFYSNQMDRLKKMPNWPASACTYLTRNWCQSKCLDLLHSVSVASLGLERIFFIFFVRFRIEIKRKYWLCSNEKPNLLIWCRTLQDFKEGDVSDEIAAMRLQYYEDKRRVFSKQVEETIRSGIIDDVKNEFPPVIKQPTAMNRTAGSQGRQ